MAFLRSPAQRCSNRTARADVLVGRPSPMAATSSGVQQARQTAEQAGEALEARVVLGVDFDDDDFAVDVLGDMTASTRAMMPASTTLPISLRDLAVEAVPVEPDDGVLERSERHGDSSRITPGFQPLDPRGPWEAHARPPEDDPRPRACLSPRRRSTRVSGRSGAEGVRRQWSGSLGRRGRRPGRRGRPPRRRTVPLSILPSGIPISPSQRRMLR